MTGSFWQANGSSLSGGDPSITNCDMGGKIHQGMGINDLPRVDHREGPMGISGTREGLGVKDHEVEGASDYYKNREGPNAMFTWQEGPSGIIENWEGLNVMSKRREGPNGIMENREGPSEILENWEVHIVKDGLAEELGGNFMHLEGSDDFNQLGEEEDEGLESGKGSGLLG